MQNWLQECALSFPGDSAKFKITDARLDVAIVILSTKDSVNLTKQLNDGFKRSNYQTVFAKVVTEGANIYELLSASFEGVKRLLVFAYVISANAANNEATIKDNKVLSCKRINKKL